ncbi:tyrosine-type recombinase/integrase [Providencia sp. 21OH12SH02B-Prov]|uniref:site-specific integrase n=1 Tax=Providencia sp. 21OH12SH02B-Prov TaxID=3015951 RepID=UPI0022B6C847|nr:tyrosine-type recombinase/integrase [Providencia sp. 21OH12SH02B-Prov]WBA57828.1 tyrosine-type recombinase/integrase [Providencia sp. 21OH12SH02B-Prov]
MARNRSPKNAHLPPNLYCRKGYYSYRNPETGIEYGIGRNKAEAVNEAISANLFIYGKKESLINRMASNDAIKFHDWIDRFGEIILLRDLKKKTLDDYQGRLKRIKNSFNNVPLSEIKTKDIADYINNIVSDGNITTARLMRSILKDMFNEAMSDGVIDFNPVVATRVPRNKIARTRLSGSDYIQIYNTAVEHCQPWVSMSMDLAILTGQRSGDIRKLKWNDIYDGYLWIEQEKTGTKIAIPLTISNNIANKTLQSVLDRCKHELNGKEFVLVSQKGDMLADKTIGKAFSLARSKSGLSWEGSPPTFHEIRSLASRVYGNEKSNEFANQLLGHKSMDMTRMYQDDRGLSWKKIEI